MDEKQLQVTENSELAVQSGRDTNIGIRKDELKQILETVLNFPLYKLEAQNKALERRVEMLEELVAVMQQPGEARKEAFSDPDFQALLNEASDEYARSGDKLVCENLVRLIARRSLEKDRSRLTLVLNDAVQKSAQLTKNEFAELSMILLIRNTSITTSSLEFLVDILKKLVVPLLPDLSKDESSYQYLESLACAQRDLTEVTLHEFFKQRFLGLFSHGFIADEFYSSYLPNKQGVLDRLIMPCLNNANKMQFAALNKSVFFERCSGLGLDLTIEELDSAYSFFVSTMLSNDEIKSKLQNLLPETEEIFEVWNNTALKHMRLSSVGIALGFSNLKRFDFEGDISSWIK